MNRVSEKRSLFLLFIGASIVEIGLLVGLPALGASNGAVVLATLMCLSVFAFLCGDVVARYASPRDRR